MDAWVPVVCHGRCTSKNGCMGYCGLSRAHFFWAMLSSYFTMLLNGFESVDSFEIPDLLLFMIIIRAQ
jgi:hypothetical protein